MDQSRTKKILGEDFNKLNEKSIAVIGLGGTGCIVVELLSRLPLKQLFLVDCDIVEECNLERQILYTRDDLQKSKAKVAELKLKQNKVTHTEIISNDVLFNDSNIDILKTVDLIIDCSDNFEARVSIQKASNQFNTPWILTGAAEEIGQILFVKPNQDISAMLQNKENRFCSDIGVLSPVPTIIGSYAVNIAIQYLAKGEFSKELLRFNFKNNSVMKLKI